MSNTSELKQESKTEGRASRRRIGLRILGGVVVLGLALTLSAALHSSFSQGSAIDEEPSSSASGELTVESREPVVFQEGQAGFDFTLAAGVVSSTQVVLNVGGSGSCPPMIENSEMRGEALRLTLADPEPDRICTMDFRLYGFSVTSEAPVFGEATRVVVENQGSETELRVFQQTD